jgi:hypothetical protein
MNTTVHCARLIVCSSLYRIRKADQDMTDLAFSIILDGEPHSLDFIAPDQRAFDYWTDGINCLLGKFFIHFSLQEYKFTGTHRFTSIILRAVYVNKSTNYE